MESNTKKRRNPTNGHPRSLSSVETMQLKQAELIRKRLDAVLEMQDAALRKDNPEAAPWIPSKEWLDAYHKNGDLITRLARGIRLGRDADKRHLEGMTNEQLDAQFARELVRLAPSFTDDQWAQIDRVRAQIAAFRAAAAETKFADGNQAAVKP